MAWYFYYQPVPKTAWVPALAEERQNIIKTKKPALCTVLDVDSVFDDDNQDSSAARYRGPLYFDIDSENLGTAIEQAKKLLTLIQSKGVDLDTLRCYLSGKRGVHILIDPVTFMPKIPSAGTQHLPAIYKELVWSTLFVDDVDMRVYSSKRGRQLRCVNVRREDNEQYKVSVTADELFALTPEKYAELCAGPRNEVPVEPAKFSPELGLAYSLSQDKITKVVAKRKTKKTGSEELGRFKGDWPKTLSELVLNGAGLKPDVGFNQIAMQVAITASTLGKTEEQMLEDCSGLIETHEGDSSRYGSPAKRKAFLREMFRYVSNNPCYEYNAGAVLALILPECRANADISFGEYVPDVPEHTATSSEPLAEGEEPEEPEEEERNEPVRISKAGIFVRTDEGYKRASDIGIGRAVLLRKMDDTDVGYEVEIFKHGKPKGTHILSTEKFSSKAAFQNWTLNLWSASMHTSDAQTSRLADILSLRAERKNDVSYIVTKEGVDFIVPPHAKSEDDFEIIWASPTEVVGSKGGKYHFRSDVDSKSQFNSDLMKAPDLTVADRDLIYHLLRVNSTGNMAKLIGWFCASFMASLIRRFYANQFPSLQVFGQAGAGKTKTVGLLNHMHYYMKQPKVLQSIGQTPYVTIATLGSSASQVVIFEELKAREMDKRTRDFLLNILRCNYDALEVSRGGIDRDKAGSGRVINNYGNAAPVAFVGEAIESQAALLERCVIVPLSKSDRYGRDHHYNYCMSNITSMGKVGKAIVRTVLSTDTRSLRKEFDATFARVKEQAGSMGEDKERPVFNMAVTITGLSLFRLVIHNVFGTEFDEEIEGMREHLFNNVRNEIPENMQEASRVLDLMATLSRHPDIQCQLVKGVDYTIGDTTMDLKLRTAYAKYVRYQRSLGMEVLYDNENAFITGLANYGGTVSKACVDNDLLFDSPKAVVFRLSLDYLDKEGVDSFRD